MKNESGKSRRKRDTAGFYDIQSSILIVVYLPYTKLYNFCLIVLYIRSYIFLIRQCSYIYVCISIAMSQQQSFLIL